MPCPILASPWQVQKIVLRGMAEQHISGGGFNWRHGETYLTPAMGKAINYAQHNPYGSELISNALYYYKKIIHKYPEENLPEVITTSPILDLLDVSHRRRRISRPGLYRPDASDVDAQSRIYRRRMGSFATRRL